MQRKDVIVRQALVGGETCGHALPQQAGGLRNQSAACTGALRANTPDVDPAIAMATQFTIGCIKPDRAVRVLTSSHQAALAGTSADVQADDTAIFGQHNAGGL